VKKPAKLPPHIAELANDPEVRGALWGYVEGLTEPLSSEFQNGLWSTVRTSARTVLLLVELLDAADGRDGGR
jgi:hypothetical protein